jgi:hypothetical protein
MVAMLRRRTSALVAGAAALTLLTACQHRRSVTTYHYDSLRSGWNSEEERLKPAKVAAPAFGLLHSVTLDDQVDTQPLVVAREKITAGSSPGRHDVVYVATEGDTIYAIDASSGAVLLSPNFGTPVPRSALPGGCVNNGPNVGIDGTPVIDLESHTMYVIIYTLEGGSPVYRIHALDLGNLTDKVTPVVVTASHTLTDHATFNFNASYQRQRPGLLEANGNVYAGFGSFCDIRADVSRGWLLGWQTGSLTPLAANQLNDVQATSPNSFFLSSIWMSGYGVAADPPGNLYFITGNSDYSGTTYDGVTNIQESVLKVSPDLTKVVDLFTPSNASNLDQFDADYGSGGALLLPEQPGPTPRLVAAAGKDGRMFLLSRDSMGGYTPGGPDKVVGMANVGGCWCGQSYFSGSDGTGRIVGSGGSNINVWKVETSPSVTLVQEASSAGIGGAAQDPGFFTSISSDDRKDAIIWAVSRPNSPSPPDVSLHAFKAELSGGGTTLTTLFQSPAGTWPNLGGNANIVPVVANGKVYVASYKQLTIFGLP